MTPREVIDALLAGRARVPGAEARAYAPANIALVKYWGKRDAALNLPVTDSLSISLGGKGVHAQIRPSERDTLVINGAALDPAGKEARRMTAFLDLFRGPDCPGFALDTRSTVPVAAGLASSAAAFAAVVLALDRLFGWQLPPSALSQAARLGSGSACRSVFTGFVRWRAGQDPHGRDSHAEPAAPAWPEFRVGVLQLSVAAKKIGSRDGMNRTVAESPLYAAWPDTVAADLRAVEAALAARDFIRLGAAAERNALAMHGTMLGCSPPLLYFLPESVAAIHLVQDARAAGLSLYLTMDAGPNVKLLYLAPEESKVRALFPALESVDPWAAVAED
jgi:diphosphomevalonate decarboxylase